jgi:hypothetical protein
MLLWISLGKALSQRKRAYGIARKPLIYLVAGPGFEPGTFRLSRLINARCFDTAGLPASVDHANVIQFAFTHPATHVIPKDRTDEHPGDGPTERGTDRLRRALHLTAQAGQAQSF